MLRSSRADVRPAVDRRRGIPQAGGVRAPHPLAVRVAPARRARDRSDRPGRRLHAAPTSGEPREAARTGDALDQGRLGQPVQLVQGSRGLDRHHHGARVRLRGRLVRVHREPGERHRRACREGRDGLLRVRSGRPGAGEDPVDRGVRSEGGPRQRQLRRRQPALLRGCRGVAVGVRQREHAAVLRGGVEVAGIRDRRATRLAPPGPRRGAHRVRGAADQDPSRVQRADRHRRGRREAVPRFGGPGAKGAHRWRARSLPARRTSNR